MSTSPPTDPGALYDELERRDIMTAAYFGVLADDPMFVAEAAAMPARMRLSRKAAAAALAPLGGFTPAPGAEHDLLARVETLQALWRTVTGKADAVALQFARRWHFPGWTHDYFVEAVLLALVATDGTSPAAFLHVPAEVRLRSRASRKRSPTESEPNKEIALNVPPLRFTYTPYAMTPSQARSKIKAVLDAARDDAERQLRAAEKIFQAAGFKRLHPKRQSNQLIALGARVVWRYLCRHETWDEIGEHEPLFDKTLGIAIPRTESGVRGIFQRWIEDAGITGRPLDYMEEDQQPESQGGPRWPRGARPCPTRFLRTDPNAHV